MSRRSREIMSNGDLCELLRWHQICNARLRIPVITTPVARRIPADP